MPEVWRNTPSRVRAGQKTWLGTFKMYGAPGEVETDDATKTAIGVVPAPKNWRVFVGLAGLVAEQIADGVSDSGDAWTVEDVATVLHILGEASPDIEREVAFMCAA